MLNSDFWCRSCCSGLLMYRPHQQPASQFKRLQASKPPNRHDKDQYQLWKSCPPNHVPSPISKGGLWLWRLCPRAARRKLGSRGHSETRSSQMHWSSSGSSRSRNLRSNGVCRFANVTTCITKRKYGAFLKYGYRLNHWWKPLIIRNNSLDDFGVNPHIHWRFPHGEAQRWCRQWKGHWGDTQLENHGKSGGNKVQAVGNWQCRWEFLCWPILETHRPGGSKSCATVKKCCSSSMSWQAVADFGPPNSSGTACFSMDFWGMIQTVVFCIKSPICFTSHWFNPRSQSRLHGRHGSMTALRLRRSCLG